MSNTLSHLDASGKPVMVDVSGKDITLRSATARCVVSFPQQVAEALHGNEVMTKKGPVFHTAIIAGVMAAKRTGELIPLCHPLGLEDCQVSIRMINDHQAEVRCTASIHGKTGVEMEAMTGASIAALTIYDMCKVLSHDIVISDLSVVKKSGGKNDFDREAS